VSIWGAILGALAGFLGGAAIAGFVDQIGPTLNFLPHVAAVISAICGALGGRVGWSVVSGFVRALAGMFVIGLGPLILLSWIENATDWRPHDWVLYRVSPHTFWSIGTVIGMLAGSGVGYVAGTRSSPGSRKTLHADDAHEREEDDRATDFLKKLGGAP
jgi:hypothetical protein